MNPVLQQEVPRQMARPSRLIFPLTSREIPYGYSPGSGLGLSIIGHSLAVLLVFLFARYLYLQPQIATKPQIEAMRSNDILILPTLGGGSEGNGLHGGATGEGSKPSIGIRAQSRRGFAYPGPQPIVSNPPNATPGIQTILQPSLENLPRLRRYVPLPNIVQPPPAAAEVAKKESPIVVKSGRLSFRQPAETTIATPKITLPLAAKNETANLVESKPQLPKRAVPDAIKASEISDAHGDQKGLLVLNAVPPPPDVNGKLPRGEARSLFAVSPGEATVIAQPSAGTKSGGQTGSAGSGNQADIEHGDALAEVTAGGEGPYPTASGSGTGNGGRNGNGNGRGLNSEGGSAGTGRGTSAGAGIGTGAGSNAGSGAGAGKAPGTGGFPGITIQGGRYGNTNVAALNPSSDPHRHGTYNMTIVSTSHSGGGLPDLGVFQDEKVYTVYLDMRANDADPAPTWTMQYAVLQPADPPGIPVKRITGTPTAPYAMLKEVPELSPEVARKLGRGLIIASAIMDTDGKLEQVAIKQTPSVEVDNPVVEALKHWLFEPAQVDGQPVAVKILLGIRLAR